MKSVQSQSLRKIAVSTLCLGSVILGLQTSAQTTIITFDDLVGAGALPVNYQGLTWTAWEYYDQPQPPYNPSSSPQRIYNEFGNNNNLIEFNETVTFEGLWIAGFSYGQYVIGYDNGVPIFTSTPQLNDASEFGNYVTVNWPGVDAISVYTDSGDFYILDDIKFTRGTSVPDAGVMLPLLGGSLAVLGYISRRLRRASGCSKEL